MEKKLLSTAIAGALAATMSLAANADVTVYGNVNVSVDAVDVDGGEDDVNMSSNTSSFGFKGSEDLGYGLKAIFQAEFQFEADERNGGSNDPNSIVDRDQWVGLAGDFGKIRFGTMSTAYKSHGAMIDPIYRTSLQGRDHGLQSRLHGGANGVGGRLDNQIRYDSPEFMGFGAIVNYAFDSQDNNGATALENDGDDTYGIGIHYNNGPILAFADYLTSDAGGEDEAWKVGGSFTMGQLAFYGQYEWDEGLISGGNNALNTNDGGDVWHLGASYTMGNTLAYFAYGMGDDDSSAIDTEYDVWTLAVDHRLSKRTDVYAGFTQIDCDADCTTGGAVSAGALSSSGTNSFAGFTGGEVDFFSVGMRHKF